MSLVGSSTLIIQTWLWILGCLPCFIAPWIFMWLLMLFCSLRILMNDLWLDVLGLVLQAAYLVHSCQHVEASNLAVHLFITLLPIRNVLISNGGNMLENEVIVWMFCARRFVLISIVHRMLWLALTCSWLALWACCLCLLLLLACLCACSRLVFACSWLVFACSWLWVLNLISDWIHSIRLLPFREYACFLLNLLLISLLDCASCLPMHLGYLLDG